MHFEQSEVNAEKYERQKVIAQYYCVWEFNLILKMHIWIVVSQSKSIGNGMILNIFCYRSSFLISWFYDFKYFPIESPGYETFLFEIR